MLFLLDFLQLKFIFSYFFLCQHRIPVSNLAGFPSAEKVKSAACWETSAKFTSAIQRPGAIVGDHTSNSSTRYSRHGSVVKHSLMTLLIGVTAPESINQLIPPKPDWRCFGKRAVAAVFTSVRFSPARPHSMTPVELSFFKASLTRCWGVGGVTELRSDAG